MICRYPSSRYDHIARALNMIVSYIYVAQPYLPLAEDPSAKYLVSYSYVVV